jgi:hypothetical protein
MGRKFCLTLRALAACAQVVPGINAGLMPIIPVEANRILAHALHLLGPQLLFVERKQRRRLLDRLSGTAIGFFPFLIAGSAGAGVAQPLEGKVRDMAVFPINVHPCASRGVYLDEFWISEGHVFSIARESC